MGMSDQHHTPAALYPRGKDPRYPLYRRLGGPQSRSGHRGYRKNPLPLPGIEPRTCYEKDCQKHCLYVTCTYLGQSFVSLELVLYFTVWITNSLLFYVVLYDIFHIWKIGHLLPRETSITPPPYRVECHQQQTQRGKWTVWHWFLTFPTGSPATRAFQQRQAIITSTDPKVQPLAWTFL
jgi:hypothetical protein